MEGEEKNEGRDRGREGGREGEQEGIRMKGGMEEERKRGRDGRGKE